MIKTTIELFAEVAIHSDTLWSVSTKNNTAAKTSGAEAHVVEQCYSTVNVKNIVFYQLII